MIERANCVTLIFSKKGGGKSTLARELARDYPRRITSDPMRECRDGVIVKSYGDAVDYLRNVKDGRQFSLILRTTNPQDELKLVDLAMYGEPDKPVLPDIAIYIDELDRLCSPTTLPESLRKLANYGRHYRVSFIGVARSPKRIHRDFTRAADIIYVGKLNEPADVDFLNEYIGGELCERAKTIPDYFPGMTRQEQFICWPDDNNNRQTESEDDRLLQRDDVPPEGGSRPEPGSAAGGENASNGT